MDFDELYATDYFKGDNLTAGKTYGSSDIVLSMKIIRSYYRLKYIVLHEMNHIQTYQEPENHGQIWRHQCDLAAQCLHQMFEQTEAIINNNMLPHESSLLNVTYVHETGLAYHEFPPKFRYYCEACEKHCPKTIHHDNYKHNSKNPNIRHALKLQRLDENNDFQEPTVDEAGVRKGRPQYTYENAMKNLFIRHKFNQNLNEDHRNRKNISKIVSKLKLHDNDNLFDVIQLQQDYKNEDKKETYKNAVLDEMIAVIDQVNDFIEKTLNEWNALSVEQRENYDSIVLMERMSARQFIDFLL